jgi:diguanylate cyclase (GGDEF)-like protein
VITRSTKSKVGRESARSEANAVGPCRLYLGWGALSVALLVIGIVASSAAGRSVGNGDLQRSDREFRTSSAGIASDLQLAIQHEDDLVVSASAYVAGDPNGSNAQFQEWVTSVRAFDRYPELLGVGHARIVTAAELPAFVRRATLDPAGTLAPDGAFQIIPPGLRPFYCFTVANEDRPGSPPLPAGFDFCGSPLIGAASITARDSGLGSYTPIDTGAATNLSISTPVYRGGVAPAGVEARRASFLGWVGMSFDPKVVLDRALDGHPNASVSFRYHSGSSDVTFRSGTAPNSPSSTTIDLHNGWKVSVLGTGVPRGILANRNAFGLLLAGIAFSFMLAALVFVLGTGRSRALRLVGERTGALRHQALHDALTGLPNRALIMDRMEQLLARSRRNGVTGAALYIDLDDFKDVNDTLGHAAGDRLLVAVAERLESTMRDADTIGRMGGDEFVVLIDGVTLNSSPELVAQRLLDVMRQPFELDAAALPITVNTSVGIAMGDRTNPGDLLRDADVALYQAKAAGKNRYEIFHPEMQTEISQRIELEFDLRSALEDEQFRLVYQPIYNLDDISLVAVEALLRWEHPRRGLIQPDEFIPILEQSGQIREVGRWVLREACAQTAKWRARGDLLDVSVNVSGRQLDDDAIVDHIRDALAESGLEATALIIEVTETALMRNADHTATRLAAIKQLGVRIAVDDFGTGYSSLAYLQQFPVDCIKIDRSFTNAITTSPESKALIGTLVQLGRDLGLKTLAEGVETVDEMDHLRAEHVDEAQGFLMSRPLDPGTLETRLLEPTRPPAPNVAPKQ